MGDPYVDYYHRQATGAGLPTFQGLRVQRGSGLGGLLNAAFRAYAPALKRVGKAALRQGASAGAHILGDMLSGESTLGRSAKHRLMKGGKRFAKQAFLGQVPAPLTGLLVPKRKKKSVQKKAGTVAKVRRNQIKGQKKRVKRTRPQLGGGRGSVRSVRKVSGSKCQKRSANRGCRDIFSI